MGFNIEQYELNYNEGWSNVSGNDALRGAGTVCAGATPVYGIPLTYAGFQMTKKGREKISENRQICQARQAARQEKKQGTIETTPSVSIDVPKTDVPTSVPSNGAVSSVTPDATKSNVGLYIGIGVGVLAIGIITVVLLTRKK